MAKRNDQPEKETNTPTDQSNTSTQSTNHAAPAYLEAAARLSTSRPLGAPRTDTEVCGIVYNMAETPAYAEDTYAIPGIMVLDYMPTLGISKDANSPLNRAAFYEFNRIREKISGNRTYEPVDHMIYRQCVDGLRELYAYIRRAYTILRTYSALNLYKPKFILESMRLNFEDWNTNAALVYQWLCNHKSALVPFPTVPIGKISARREIFNSAIFLDGDSPTAQSYIFNQIGFYSYEEVDQVKGIKIARPTTGTVQEYFKMWDNLYEALQSSSDVYTIAADIRRAFEDQVVTDLTPPQVDEEVTYIKLDPVLTSIMNATTLATFEEYSKDIPAVESEVANALKIYDGGNGILKCMGSIRTEFDASTQGNTPPRCIHTTGFMSHLNFVESNPDTAAIVNAVRFKPVLSNNVDITFDSTANVYKMVATTNIDAIGTEAILTARCYRLYSYGLAEVENPSTLNIYNDNAVNAVLDNVAMSGNFDWLFPQMFAWVTNPGTSFTNIVEDTQNYVPVTKQIISQLHEAILLAEFNIPG